ncbi:hypothetical protein LCGC14_1352480 [marine sediment metagenome]|uniref:Uncharacterized protein n=1 Tax=marine sediment metagenome TaxID=412755 RepID=A0A0F9KWM0_9ZZZZ
MEYAYNFELVVPLSILAGLGLVGSCLLAAAFRRRLWPCG